MSFVFDIQAGKQANALGKYNQSVQNRNALVKEQEAAAIEKQTEFDIAKFNQSFEQMEGTTRVSLAKSGVELSGTALKILQSNAEQAELQRNVIEYNGKVKQNQKLEEANFSRMSGSLARMQGKQAQIGYYAQAGSSLLTMAKMG
jgi:hypothetical protein